MIEFRNISKTFITKTNTVEAVKDVSFTINKEEIFGVIGHSGAGKSTLVRLINFLETPTSGEVVVNGTVINKLSAKELRQTRRKIGIIFQNFNLMESINVYDNIAFPLRYQDHSKEEIDKKVKELLELVGISDKIHAYPSQLSGGQKQRVAIARALANDPDILLCDEATSALDPKTTHNVLELIKDLNKKLKLTVVVITHEMNVVKSICDRVAIMEDGNVVELGDVIDVFRHPKTTIAKEFIQTTQNTDELPSILEKSQSLGNGQILKLSFLGSQTSDAVIVKMCKSFDVEASILYAQTDLIKNEVLGNLIISLTGDNIPQAINYLNQQNIQTEVL